MHQLGDGLVLLQLNDALSAPQKVTAVPAAPFAGSASYWVAFSASDNALPAWPVLRQGFFARYTDPQVPRLLGIDTPPGPWGGPVFDSAGRVAGLAISGEGGLDVIVPVSRFAQMFSAPSIATATLMSMDSIYELALRTTVQVIAER